MITTTILTALTTISGLLFGALPTVSLPSTWTAPLYTMMGYWNTMREIMPYLNILTWAFLFIFWFEVGLLILKFLFGNRAPTNN